MYAVVNTGGKQYRVEPGQVLRVEKLDGEVGDKIELKPVLMVGGEGKAKIGTPHLEGAVSATITQQGRAKKVVVFKKKRRKAYKVKRGHRQHFTEVRIEAIEA